MKKIIPLIVLIVLVIGGGLFVFTAGDKGECGDNVKWSYNPFNKTLTVSGKGAMYNFAETGFDPPWFEEYRQSVSKVVIKSGVTSVGDYAFDGMGVEQVSLCEGITYIGKSAFSFANITELTLPESLEKIGEGAFIKNMLTELTIPENVKEIGPWAFRHSDELISVNVKGNITLLDSEVFALCETMTKLTLPATLKEIAVGALYGCGDLDTIVFEGSEAEWNEITVGYDNDLSEVVIEYTS